MLVTIGTSTVNKHTVEQKSESMQDKTPNSVTVVRINNAVLTLKSSNKKTTVFCINMLYYIVTGSQCVCGCFTAC